MNRKWCRAAIPEVVGQLRSAVCDFADFAGVTDPLIADARLALSEALTNAVVHGYRGIGQRGDVTVSATIEDGTLWLVVSDQGCGFSPRLDSPGLGLGLPMIAQLTDSFDIRPGTPNGTEIHMTFDRRVA